MNFRFGQIWGGGTRKFGWNLNNEWEFCSSGKKLAFLKNDPQKKIISVYWVS